MSNTNNTERPDLKDLPYTTSFNSASAYASAESSPRQSLTSSLSASSFKNVHNTLEENGNSNDDMYKSANSSTNNSFSDLAQANSEQASVSTLSTMSGVSVVATTNVKKIIGETIQSTLQEKQPAVSTTTTSPAPTTKASVLSFIEKMFVKASPPPNQTKPTLSNSSSSLGLSKDLTVLQSSISSSSPNPECSPFKLLDNEIGHHTQQNQQQNNSPSYQQMKTVSGSTLSPNGTTINDAVAIFNASNAAAAAAAATAASTSSTITVDSLKKTTLTCPEGTIVQSSSMCQAPESTSESKNKIIESLALLNNHKEHERADPVLQSSILPLKNFPTSSHVSSSSNNMIQQVQQYATTTQKQSINPVDIPFDAPLLKHESSATNIDKEVPASSREFCMDINFNLAAAAAVFAAAPLAISDNTKFPSTTSASNSEKECANKLTWNASTNSIHNDLKMILEEGKKGAIGETKTALTKDKPKPQRVNQHARDNKLNNQTESNGSSGTGEGDLIKIMMKMIENNKLGSSDNSSTSPSTTTRRYTNEVLHQIRSERADFIEKLMPDIFKAYCYCMTGRSWDPEKYFDVVQFPGEDFEKIQRQREERKSFTNGAVGNNSNGMSKNRNNSHSGSNTYQRKSNTSSSVFNKKKPNHSVSSNGLDSMQIPEHQQKHLQPFLSNIESPEQQPLQVPKNSPKSQQQNKSSKSLNNNNSSKAKKSTTLDFKSEFGPGVFLNIVSDEHANSAIEVGQSHTNADKILMGLLSKTPVSSKSSDNINLLDLLNQNNNSKTAAQRRSSQRNSLEPSLKSPNTSANLGSTCFSKKFTTSPKSTTIANNHISVDSLFGLNSSKALSSILGVQNPKNSTQPPRHYPKIYSAQELEMSQLNQSNNNENSTTVNNKQHRDSKETSSTHSPNAKSPVTKATSVNELFGFVDPTSITEPHTLDLNNNSNAYKQLVKNLSNHPLSAPPPAKFAADKANNSHLYKTQSKKAQQQNTTTTTPPDSSNILKQLLNINIEANMENDENEKKKSTSSSARSAKKASSNHQHSKKSKSPKEKNSTETLKQYKDDKFPVINPHERPFQNLHTTISDVTKDLSLATGDPFENLILKMKQSQLNQIMEINKQELDLKKKKVHLNTEYEHFNSLLNKIMPSLTNTIPAPNMPTSASTSFLSHNQFNERNMNTSASSNNILKWFDRSVKH